MISLKSLVFSVTLMNAVNLSGCGSKTSPSSNGSRLAAESNNSSTTDYYYGKAVDSYGRYWETEVVSTTQGARYACAQCEAYSDDPSSCRLSIYVYENFGWSNTGNNPICD